MMMIVNIARYLPHLCSILVEFDASSHHISTNVHAIVFYFHIRKQDVIIYDTPQPTANSYWVASGVGGGGGYYIEDITFVSMTDDVYNTSA